MSAEAFREKIIEPRDSVILALDNMSWDTAISIMRETRRDIGNAKVESIIDPFGAGCAIRTCHYNGFQTMVDVKFNRTPSAMEESVEQVALRLPKFITIHASSGVESMKSAVVARDNALGRHKDYFERNKFDNGNARAGLLGITVMTSLSEQECLDIYGDKPKKKVMQFARMAVEAGLDGVVCAVDEVEMLRNDQYTKDLLLVVSGIVPKWSEKPKNQKRVGTPSQAVNAGADFLVVGRAITAPPERTSRLEATQKVIKEIARTKVWKSRNK